jgi:hypothetical protein
MVDLEGMDSVPGGLRNDRNARYGASDLPKGIDQVFENSESTNSSNGKTESRVRHETDKRPSYDT